MTTNRARVESDVPLVSASQIKLYRECPRKWAWQYLAKLRTPQHPAAALGQEVDDEQLQPYLTTGRPFDTRVSGDIARAGLHLLPAVRSDQLEVQKHFILPSPTRPTDYGFQGYLDCWLPLGEAVSALAAPAVVDFKTTSNFRYALNEDRLSRDVQAQLYATWAMFETGARGVDLVWLYFKTRTPYEAKRVHLRVAGQHVAEQFVAIDKTASEMFDVRAASAGVVVEDYVKSLEPNVDMCDEYGGCPFKSKCNLGPGEISEFRRRQTAKENNSMSAFGSTANLFASLQKKKQQQDAPAAPAKQQEPFDKVAGAVVLDPEPSIGINPPESALPPAPVEAPKTKAAPKPRATKAAAAATTEETEGDNVTVTWGEWLIQPVNFNSFRVGPFTASGRVRDGETRTAAARRLYDELNVFALQIAAETAASFRTMVKP